MQQPSPLAQPLTITALTDEQLAAFEDRIVERVAALIADHWLPREPMTPDGLAEYLHVSRETIRRWTVSGALRSWQFGHTILYLPDDIAAFLGRAPETESEAA